MFSWNRLFLSLFESCLLTCLLALFCFSTCAFFQLPLFRLPGVLLCCLVVLFRSTSFFYLLSLFFANLHINNVICKLFCCFLTTNPDRCFVVICLLFSLSLMSFCVFSSFSVFLFSAFCAFFFLFSPFSFVLFPPFPF